MASVAAIVARAVPVSRYWPEGTNSNVASILILGGDAVGNLGDRGYPAGHVPLACGVRAELALTVVSRDAQRVRQSFGPSAVPRGPRGLLAFCRAIRRSQLVLVGGGGLFQDDDSLVKMPYWALRGPLVRLLGRPVVGYALGVGPLSSVTGWPARGSPSR